MNTTQPSQAVQALLAEAKVLQLRLEKLRKKYTGGLAFAIFFYVLALTAFFLMADIKAVRIEAAVIFGALPPSLLTFHIMNILYRGKARQLLTAALARAGNMTYSATGSFTTHDVKAHKILPKHERSQAQDGMEGFYRNVPFVLQSMTLTGGGFRGTVVRLRLKRAFESHTILVQHSTLRTLGNRFGDYTAAGQFNTKSHGQVDILSTDQIEARVVVTPAIIEHILALGLAMKSDRVTASFLSSEILITLQRGGQPAGMPPLWKPVSSQVMRRPIDELSRVFALIDALKSNPQIGL